MQLLNNFFQRPNASSSMSGQGPGLPSPAYPPFGGHAFALTRAFKAAGVKGHEEVSQWEAIKDA
jgi:hypothetical protein